MNSTITGSLSEERSNQLVYHTPSELKVKTDALRLLTILLVQQMQLCLANSQLCQDVHGEQLQDRCLQASALLITSKVVLHKFYVLNVASFIVRFQ